MGIANKNLLIGILPSSASILACLGLFYCYYLIPKRTVGLKMILVISLSDFIFHSTAILFDLIPVSSLTVVPMDFSSTLVYMIIHTIEYLNAFGFIFSMFWACNMAFFLYRPLSMNITINPQLYFSYSLLAMLFLASAVNLINMEMFGNISLLIECLIGFSLIFIAIYYCKSIFIVRTHSDMMLSAVQINTRDLYIYTFLPVMTYGPAILNIFKDNETLVDLQRVLVGLSGFLNAVAYMFQRMRSSEVDRISVESLEDYTETKNRDSIQTLLMAEANQNC